MTKCAIPVFEGLLPEPHNTYVLNLLFDLAHWHGLAKLRMHTDPTLEVLDQVTKSLGNNLSTFEKRTCSLFQTRELEREHAARHRRQEKDEAGKKKNAHTKQGTAEKVPESSKLSSSTRKPKQLSLKTYKYHAVGDYVDTIRRYGTTDSYSTQGVSSQLISILYIMIMSWFRVNLSTASRRRAFLRRVADRYRTSWVESSNVSDISTRSMMKDSHMYRCPHWMLRILFPTLQPNITSESRRGFMCIYQLFCRKMKVIQQ